VGTLLNGVTPVHGGATAALLATAETQRLRGVGGLLSGIATGAVLGGGIGYVAVAVLGASLSLTGVISLGGGIGVVANYIATGEQDTVDETMTVERQAEPATPTPVDLFDSHPDPILYVADEGHGPVVRAANAAYADAFDVPTDAVLGAPLEEAVFATDRTNDIVAAVNDGEPLDIVASCQAATGNVPFRIRTAVTGEDCYLVYTPQDT